MRVRVSSSESMGSWAHRELRIAHPRSGHRSRLRRSAGNRCEPVRQIGQLGAATLAPLRVLGVLAEAKGAKSLAFMRAVTILSPRLGGFSLIRELS
jgi:hypothetical protein